jgi:hypothetical protein
MAIQHAITTTDHYNQIFQEQADAVMTARYDALILGHELSSFQQIEGPIYGATCLCGDMAFVNLSTGKVEGRIFHRRCPLGFFQGGAA